MRRLLGRLCFVAFVLVVAVPSAKAIVESDTKTEYPDEVTVADQVLKVTGVGLREKTFMKVDVYTIVSYVAADADLGDDLGAGLVNADAPKQMRMDLRRGFSREKLINSFKDVIEKNYDDTSAFDADMETFFGFFTRDAAENDILIFTYVPGTGLTTVLNGEEKAVIPNFAFTQALWTVWFGNKPASGGLKKDLLSAL